MNSAIGQALRFCVFALILLSLAPLSYSAESDEVWLLQPIVQERATGLLKAYKKTGNSLKLFEIQEINNAGNFGKIIYYERQTSFSRQESGLWAIVGAGNFTSGAAAGFSQTLSLCGLITLLTTTNSTTKLETNTPIPFGKLFLPFGIRTSIGVGTRVRVADLRTDYEDICSPIPGTKFTYHIENEAQVKTTGLFGRSTQVSAKIDVLCQVSSSVVQAKEINPGMRGDYLLVSCEGTAHSGQKSKTDYAFLIEPGVYLILSTGGGAQTTKVQYKTVDYSD